MKQSAAELKYGYGFWMPDETPEQRTAREAGLVRARCACTTWTLVPRQVGDKCRACGRPMNKIES